jgi:hypothetical protein
MHYFNEQPCMFELHICPLELRGAIDFLHANASFVFGFNKLIFRTTVIQQVYILLRVSKTVKNYPLADVPRCIKLGPAWLDVNCGTLHPQAPHHAAHALLDPTFQVVAPLNVPACASM